MMKFPSGYTAPLRIRIICLWEKGKTICLQWSPNNLKIIFTSSSMKLQLILLNHNCFILQLKYIWSTEPSIFSAESATNLIKSVWWLRTTSLIPIFWKKSENYLDKCWDTIIIMKFINGRLWALAKNRSTKIPTVIVLIPTAQELLLIHVNCIQLATTTQKKSAAGSSPCTHVNKTYNYARANHSRTKYTKVSTITILLHFLNLLITRSPSF